MKKILTTILFVLFLGCVVGQEIELQGVYSLSSYLKFKNNFGCKVGFTDMVTQKSRLGVYLGFSVNNIPYHESFTSLSDLLVNNLTVTPCNQRISLTISYSANLLKSTRSELFLGGGLGLNWFLIQETGTQQVTSRFGNITTSEYSSSYSVNNRIGIGLLLEYEQKDIIWKRLSASISILPELVFYHAMSVKGISDPAMLGWLNFNLGFKYCFR